jgi:small-conductance mechanosensitive channel
MKRDLKPRSITALVTGIAIILAFGLVFVLPERLYSPPWGMLPPEIAMLLQIKVFITTFNFLLLLTLTAIYTTLYRDLPNKYTLSLLLLSLVLLLYAFTSNPIVQVVFGFSPRPDIGVFGFLPDFFVGIAIVVLLYQSQT